MKQILYIIAIAMLLASCSKQEAEEDRLSDGEYPVNLIATMQEQTSSRVTTDNTWRGTEQIAVEIGGEVKKHIADEDGALNLGQGVSPWYWLSSSECKSVTAWYSISYSTTRPTIFTVQDNQKQDIMFWLSDMIYASQQITPANQILIFKHLPAKVMVNLKAGDGISSDEVRNATVTIVNQATTSGTIADDWSVAQVTEGSETIEPLPLDPATSGYHKSFKVLLVPQQMQNKKFIKITILGNNYYYTPKNATDANLTAGKLHTLNLVVKSSGLEFSSSTVEQWDDTEKGEGEVKPAANVGDYYYKDKTYSTDFKGTPSNPCIGVIYQVATDGMTGMIVSLDETKAAWSDLDADTHATDWDRGKWNRNVIQSYIHNNPGKSWDNFPAFKWCNNKNKGREVDWYLPATSELSALYTAYDGYDKVTFDGRFTASGVGGTAFSTNDYWSATESDNSYSWIVDFIYGDTFDINKTYTIRVRCVREF